MNQLARNICIWAVMLPLASLAQDTLNLEEVVVNQKTFGLKKQGLYEGTLPETRNIRGFTQLDIFSNSLGDFWTSENAECVSAQLNPREKNTSMTVSWDTDRGDCGWVGMGFGWDGWKAKDMNYVLDTMAVEMVVRSTGEDFTNIPWAFCFEDYSGGQAWLGFQSKFLQSEKISKDWTKVLVPVQLFPFESNEVDATSIKQFMIQIFGSGEIEIASIACVPFAGATRAETKAKFQGKTIDGKHMDWGAEEFNTIDDQHKFAVAYDQDKMYFCFQISDDTPRQNDQKGNALWNGDAIEIAFSTNPKADPNRKFMLLSDQHLGINCGANPYVWNWKTDEIMQGAELVITELSNGYLVELAIPASAFKKFKLEANMDLDLEIAIDLGDGESRKEQIRWNSGGQEGFHVNPSLWGGLQLSHNEMYEIIEN